jgi:CHAT domain-containing protein
VDDAFKKMKSVIKTIPLICTLLFWMGCMRHQDPQTFFDRALQAYQRGDITTAEQESDAGYRSSHTVSPEWAWKFTILKARVLHWKSQNDELLKLLASEQEAVPPGNLTVLRLRYAAVAYVSLRNFAEAEKNLKQAEEICAAFDHPACAEVVSTRGRMEMEHGHYAQAQVVYQKALQSARDHSNRFLEANALLDLSFAADEQTHFDEALDWADGSRRISTTQGYADVSQAALGNMGWAYYKLGNSERALEMFVEAQTQAEKLHDTTDQVQWLTNAGLVHMDAGEFDIAESSFQQSLNLARGVKSKRDIVNSLIALAFVSEQTNKFNNANRYADEALTLAQQDGNKRDEVYPLLVKGLAAARVHDTATAEAAFQEVAKAADAPVFLKWEAERALAQVYDDEKHPAAADREYQTALSTFETARSNLQREDSRLPFLTNAVRIYDDYIQFLADQKKTDEALQVAEYSRARTLNEGLGLLKKGSSFKLDALKPQEIARRAGGTIFFYALGEKQSYLWVIAAQKTVLFPIPATRADIEMVVQRYRKKLTGPPQILQASDDGTALYQLLVAPAHDFLTPEALGKNGKIFIVPDASLNSLNFETLQPQKDHYWIEDVTITNASSLRLLSVPHDSGKKFAGNLLVMGNPVAPASGLDTSYPELPNSATEMENVENHFAARQQTVFAREKAVPDAYLTSKPERFAYIHFVAHGTASRLSPLDSAVILSRPNESKAAAQDDSFKLYARDIIKHPLRAELVTISACYSAGDRAYSGEGLVGLSWAFLYAGSHNVVGALWDVSDVSISQLMDKFYAELQQGKRPDEALRAAKLSLLHSDNAAFHRPFYWAPFQLYTGS